MTADGKVKLRQLLLQHESYRQYPYSDTNGKITVGIGRNLVDRGVSLNEAYYLLDEDINYFSGKLSSLLSFFDDLDEPRKIALIDMCFNLGVQGFMGFRDMLMALAKQDYLGAAKAMMDSKWAHQVGERAMQLAQIIMYGRL